ncbi:MAG: putative quinol monooxygenase [Paracoccaceae bacterium]
MSFGALMTGYLSASQTFDTFLGITRFASLLIADGDFCVLIVPSGDRTASPERYFDANPVALDTGHGCQRERLFCLMYVVTVTFEIDPDRIDEFMPLMLANARASRDKEPGCHQFDVCRVKGESRVHLYEVYDNAAAFKAHLASPHFLEFDAAVSAMIQHKAVMTFDEVHQ